MQENEKNEAAIKRYYLDSRESRWGYKYLLRGTKHYGYYPTGKRLSMADSQVEMEKLLGRTIGLKQGATVLDAGCGEGYVAIHLAEFFGYQITGIDLLEVPSIKVANKNKSRFEARNVSFHKMDYSNLDFPDNSFDAIYTIETLVHSPDYKKTLSEFYRVLKPDGVLVNFEYIMDDKMPPEVEDVWRLIYKEGSMHTLDDFRLGKVESRWKNVGFKSVEVTDLSEGMHPFMHRLYQIAFIPYQLLKMFKQEKNHLNTYVGYISYLPRQRNTFHYCSIRAIK